MLLQPNDILLAFKHISLSEELNGTEKQFAGFLVDSYNRKTGRCDPSEETAAFLLQKSVRTIVRAGNKLVHLRLFIRRKHAGHNHCNSYLPNWEFFRESEERFKIRRRERANRFTRPKVSRSECQPCHSSGASLVTQTSPTNNIQSTYPIAAADDGPNRQTVEGKQSGLADGRKPLALLGHTVRFSSLRRSEEAATSAAERRWNNELINRYGREPIYAAIVEALDGALQAAATRAEMKKPGTGADAIMQELLRRGVL